MTSIPNLLRERLGIGRTFCLSVDLDGDGRLVATHPNPGSEYDVAVVEGLELLADDTEPPESPLSVEIRARFVDGHLAGRVVDVGCGDPANVR